MILDPNYFDSFKEFSDRLNQFPEIGTGTAQKFNEGDDWRDWAQNLVGDPDEVGRDAPVPYDFEDWRDWAELFFLTEEL